MRLHFLLLVACCVAFAAAESPADTPPSATIDSGTLQGAKFGPAPSEVMFLGIPYAAPPTGERRWKSPQPVEKWQDVRKADTYGAACPQKDRSISPGFVKGFMAFQPYYSFYTDEDCLFRNVWTTNLPGHHSSEKFPVMVWIHGGSNLDGASQGPYQPMGPALARKRVVV